MNDHAGRFVYDYQVIVFKENVKGNGFRKQLDWRRSRQIDFYVITVAQAVARLRNQLVDQNIAVLNRVLNSRSAYVFEAGRKERIQAQPYCFGAYVQELRMWFR